MLVLANGEGAGDEHIPATNHTQMLSGSIYEAARGDQLGNFVDTFAI